MSNTTYERYDYDEDGDVKDELYTGCDLDPCNGPIFKRVSAADPTKYLYDYYATSFHPYLVGCFGPTEQNGWVVGAQYCSSNT